MPILDDTKLLYDDNGKLVTGETIFSFTTAKNPADFILSELNETEAPNAVSYERKMVLCELIIYQQDIMCCGKQVYRLKMVIPRPMMY